jgi:hypothetical protein
VAADPDVTVAIPAVVTADPDPIAVLAGSDGNNFDGTRWRRPNADNDLCIRGSGREQDSSSSGEYVLFQIHPTLLVTR